MGMGNYGMGGGYGGGMGGGMGSQSTTMMSSAMGASVCLSMLAGGAYFMMNAPKATDAPETDAPGTSESSAPTNSAGDLDGARVITSGTNSMRVDGKCSNGKVTFRVAKNDKFVWNLKKVGTTPDGLNYYTMESFGKLFGAACNKRFLTAPFGCKGPPYLATAQRGPLQYWIITGSATSGYQIENYSCRQARTKSYLLQSGNAKTGNAQFSNRSGSSFMINADTAV